MIITTSQKASSAIKEETKELAKLLDLVYLNRQKRSISELLLEDRPIAVVSKNQLTIHFNEEQEHRFHLSMAQLRILRLQRGDDDHLGGGRIDGRLPLVVGDGAREDTVGLPRSHSTVQLTGDSGVLRNAFGGRRCTRRGIP